MLSTSRVLLVAALLASAPVLLVTLQTLRAAWSQDTKGGAGPGVVHVGEGVKIDEIKAQLAGGLDAIRARKEQAMSVPVTEFFNPGFTAPPLTASVTADGNDKAWEELGSVLVKLGGQREAFEVAEKHIGRQSLNLLSETQLASFAAELTPVAAAVPSLKSWPQRLQEMSRDRKATQHFLDKLNAIGRDLRDRTNSETVSLIRIPEADLRKWDQQLTELKTTKADTAALESFPTIVEQHTELKRRVDFWSSWNPPMPLGNGKPSAATLESRRTALMQLEKKAKSASHGEARLPEETEHIERVSEEIERLAGEVLYLNLSESLASKKNSPKSMAELLQKMQPIIETGAHQDDLIKDFKTAVEQGLALKKTRDSKLPVYDFVLPGGKIWLAHSDRKELARGSLWIWSYDLEKNEKVELDKEHQYLYPDTGFLKVSEPEEARIVNSFNNARNELLEKLDQIDSWKALQTELAAQERQLTAYYRQMKQFWDRPETGRHRLAPDLSFTADQKLISDVLENWRIVESLYRR